MFGVVCVYLDGKGGGWRGGRDGWRGIVSEVSGKVWFIRNLEVMYKEI